MFNAIAYGGFFCPLTPALSLREREKTSAELSIVLDRFSLPQGEGETCTELYIVLNRSPLPKREGGNLHRTLHRARSVPSP